ncbi:hypothetical protein BX600DRAFT_439824 [Xylariales sp. PMI_506]|nr:hypothetical protein BX600DRAFT_439824 [Xylariales sp. PMI_506]
MKWWAFFVVALAAPVWSRSHNHKHNHKRRGCHAVHTTTAAESLVTSQATVAAEAVETTTQAVQQTTTTAYVAVSQTTTASTAASTAKSPGRAIWLWDSDLIQDSTEVAQFLSFAESNDIDTVYALVDRDMGNTVFETFVEQCSTSGIAVQALMGNSEWILGEGDPTLDSQLEWLEQYQGNASASAQFAGIHVDIEPWALDDWETNEATYVSTLQSLVSQVTSVGATLDLPVAADLPYWAYTISCTSTSGTTTLDSWMLNTVDSVTFMTYRNTPSELLDIATEAFEAGNTAGKDIWLAVETVDAADAALISYYGQTLARLAEDLTTVNSSASVYSIFAGIAIHDYSGAIALS